MQTHIIRAVLALGICLSAPMIATLAQAQQKIDVTYPANAPPIASEYRSRKGVNGLRRPARHQGIDIKGPNGQLILAAADGRVLESDVGPCWGPTVVIDHGVGKDGKRLIAAYGHLGTVAVQAGQTVRRGQQIAKLSNNYRQFDCIVGVRHLHFQLGRVWRGAEKGTFWGHVRYLRDGKRGTNPHLYWAAGVGQVTCYNPGQIYPAGTLTYPVPCRGGS